MRTSGQIIRDFDPETKFELKLKKFRVDTCCLCFLMLANYLTSPFLNKKTFISDYEATIMNLFYLLIDIA